MFYKLRLPWTMSWHNTHPTEYKIKNIFTFSLIFALLLLLLDKSEFRLSFGDKEALYEGKPPSLSSSAWFLLNMVSRFYKAMLNKYDFCENLVIGNYLIYLIVQISLFPIFHIFNQVG